MRVTCSAIVDDSRKRDNLCECIEIIGAEYTANGNTVYADYTGEKETGQKLISLFSQYPVHGISIIG